MSGTIGAAPKVVICLRSWLNTDGKKKKSIKGKASWPSLPTPKIPLCFFRKGSPPSLYNQMGRLGFLTFLKLKRAGWNVCIGVDALLYKLWPHCLCGAHVYVTVWRWPLLMGPGSQCPLLSTVSHIPPAAAGSEVQAKLGGCAAGCEAPLCLF